jgi:multidrug resistance efflux pump
MASTHASYKHDQHRMHERLTLAATATVRDRDFAVRDWSFAGFSINHSPDLNLQEGEIHDLVFSLPFAHYTARCHLRAEVRHIDATQARFEFHEVEPNVRMLMRDYVRQTLHHGGNTTTPSTTQSAAEIASSGPPRTPHARAGSARRGGLLLLTGVAVVAVGAWVLQSQRNLVSTQAELVGNTVEIRARIEGYLDKVHIHSGDEVHVGQLLMELDATEARRNLAAAGYLHRQLERSVQAAERVVKEEERRNTLYSRVALGRERVEDARTQEAQAALVQAEGELQRVETLLKSGYVSPSWAETQRATALQRRAQALRSQTEAVLARDIAQEAAKGRFFGDNQVSNKLGEVVLHAEQRRTELAQALAGMGPLLAELENTRLPSPEAGKVRVINRSRGELVRKGELVAVIETQAKPNILAKFTHTDAIRLSPGQAAEIEFPALGIRLAGRVEAIGWQGLITQGGTAAVAETGIGEIPATIALHEPIPQLPSGLRARVVIDTEQDLLTILRQRMP